MNSILLPTVIEYNADLQGFSDYSTAAKKYAKLAKILGLPSSNIRVGLFNLIQHINQLSKELHMPSSLKTCGISYEQMKAVKEMITETALKDGCTPTNPRIPTSKDIETILEKIH
jgi:1-propanol dehydrogenase